MPSSEDTKTEHTDGPTLREASEGHHAMEELRAQVGAGNPRVIDPIVKAVMAQLEKELADAAANKLSPEAADVVYRTRAAASNKAAIQAFQDVLKALESVESYDVRRVLRAVAELRGVTF